MRVLIVGSGAREHALCWRLAGEASVEHVIAAPGNALMAGVAEVRTDVSANDRAAVVALALSERVDLVVIGPEAPLVDGLADALAHAGIPVFGPTAAASRLEGSKAFAREICDAARVPMAAGRAFVTVRGALEYADGLGLPLVVKADGLAGGKGVVICATLAAAERAICDALENGRFGSAGQTVIIEKWLAGVEASVIALCDGETALMLPAARDHKRLGETDTGPNTGGMGAYSPLPDLDDAAVARLRDTIFTPVLAEMAARGTPFRGALFCGLMLTADGPRVLEFNVRLGDPETQAILPRLAMPLAPLLLAAATAATAALPAGISLVPALPEATVALTLATRGYPDAPEAGDLIAGVDEARASGALVFGAGIAGDGRGGLVTAGGRVLTVVGRGTDLEEAVAAAYDAADLIEYEGKIIRRDIGRSISAVAA